MRHPNLVGLVALLVVGACATGQSLGDVGGDLGFDAGNEGSVNFASGGSSSGGASPVESGGFPESSGGSQQGSGGSATGSVTGGGGTSSGGTMNSGGTVNSGGTMSSGGKVSSGGQSTSGGTAGDAGPQCQATEKFCLGKCTTPNPGVGCALTGCTQCPSAPANGVEQCITGKCDFVCYSGYQKNAAGTSCDPTNTGSGGATGSGGSGGTCNPSTCPKCGFAACCNGAGRCGCNWVVCV